MRMHRYSTLTPLLVGAVLGWLPSNAHAQEGSPTPAPSGTPSSTQPAATPNPTVDADKADKKAEDGDKPEEKKEEGKQNARLAPGGIVSTGTRFPLGMTIVLDNTIGMGTFVPGITQQPNWGTAVTLRPNFSIPKVDFLPRMVLSGSIDFFINNWLPAFNNGEALERQLRVSDPGLSLIFPGLIQEKVTGIGVTGILNTRMPLSVQSRFNNSLGSVAAAMQASWSSPETPVGVFTVQYTPSVRFNNYSKPFATFPCNDPALFALDTRPSNPSTGIEDLPAYVGRQEEILPDGTCRLAGRQSVASLSNSATLDWSFGDHSIYVSAAWANVFLRPLESNPDLASSFASGQNFTESNSGSIGYNYSVPSDLRMQLNVGLSSSQPAYDAQGRLRFPFFDFVTPANNFTSLFFDVTLAL